jgi:ketosteroid isomerase-like protein
MLILGAVCERQSRARRPDDGDRYKSVAEPLAAVRSYARAFETLEPHAVVPFYDEQCFVTSPQGSVALPAHANVERFFEPLTGDLRNQGYATTEFQPLEERRLGPTMAMATGRGIWRKGDGTELRRFGAVYLLRKRSDGWRIAVAVYHEDVS